MLLAYWWLTLFPVTSLKWYSQQKLAEACNCIRKEILTQVLFCEFCGIFKSTFFIEHFWWLLLSQSCFQLYNIPSCTINDFLFNLSWRRPLSYRNQSVDLLCKSMDCFLYDNGLPHEMVNSFQQKNEIKKGKYPNGIIF